MGELIKTASEKITNVKQDLTDDKKDGNKHEEN